ncbi:MAG: MFS transporter [Bacteroidia bacterium]
MSNNKTQLYTLVSVFFFWGFIAASNGIFIPFCKSYFNLTQYQSQLIDATFYGGYFFGSLFLYYFSIIFKTDLLNTVGYKRGIIYGFMISILGAIAIIPSVHANSFPLILLSFFILALGFSLQQTAAQPFVVALGEPETGAQRLNLAGGINSLGTTIGPVIFSFLLFGKITASVSEASLSSISNLFLMLAGVFAIVALIFAVSKLPDIKSEAEISNSKNATVALSIVAIPVFLLLFVNDFLPSLLSNNMIYITLITLMTVLFMAFKNGKLESEKWGAMQYPQLVLGMFAIFTYVGVEVTIQSNMGALLKTDNFGSYAENKIAPFISMYWGSLMIGRLTGALSVFGLKNKIKTIFIFLLPFLVFEFIVWFNTILGKEMSYLQWYRVCLPIVSLVIYFTKDKPAKTLLLFSIFGMFAMITGLLTTGTTAIYAFLSGGLACSVMWPCIFTLAISNLGKFTGQASAFLIMMILGGAVIPPIQGKIADAYNIHFSYIVTVFCFAYLMYFSVTVNKFLVHTKSN